MKGKQYGMTIMDVSKVFDVVLNRCLLKELKNKCNRVVTIVDGDAAVTSRVPWSNVMGPRFFQAFIDSIPGYLQMTQSYTER